MVDFSKLQAKFEAKSEDKDKQPEATTDVQESVEVHKEINEPEVVASAAEVVAEVVEVKPEPKQTLFQHYHCARSSMKMITKTGIVIAFVAHKYITDNKAIINYLDAEIKLGLKVITKGEAMTEEDADPMSRLRREIIAEYLEKEAIENAAEAPILPSTGILSSSNVITAKQSSSSSSSPGSGS